MATEYKLSYTANEINKKLGKVDGIENTIDQITTAISTERARIDTIIETEDAIKKRKNSTYKTISDMINDTELENGMAVTTLGNGTDEALCCFYISDTQKDDLSIMLKNGLYANIAGHTIDLTAISQNPFSLIPTALHNDYKHIIVSGNHTIDTTIVINDVMANKCVVEFTGKITLNTTLFKITRTNLIHFTGGIFYGNNNILFDVPQETDSDRAGFTADKMYLDNCQLINLCNSSGYIRFDRIYITETTSIPFAINGDGLSIPPNFCYFSNCSISGSFNIEQATHIYFNNCDFVNTQMNLISSSNILFTSCNFVGKGRTNIVDDSRSVSFNGCVFECGAAETLFIFKNNCRGLMINGNAIVDSSVGLLIDASEMTGYMKLDIKPTYIGVYLCDKIVISDDVSVETYFPIIKDTLFTNRLLYDHVEINCMPNAFQTIPEAENVYYDSGYIYLTGTEGTEYTIIPYHT